MAIINNIFLLCVDFIMGPSKVIPVSSSNCHIDIFVKC